MWLQVFNTINAFQAKTSSFRLKGGQVLNLLILFEAVNELLAVKLLAVGHHLPRAAKLKVL